MIPVVLYFWLVIFTIYGLMFYLAEQITVIFPAVATLAGTCFFIVIYLLIRIAATRYELSNHKLTIPWQGRRTVVGLPSILNVDTQQSGLQKLLGAGDIVLDAAVNGVLSTLHIRNIPQVEQRADQIRALLSELR